MNIKLKKPIKVDGKEVKELPFDTSVFGADDLERANKMAAKISDTGTVQESDYNYHFIIAKVVVEKSSDGKISVEDLRRIKGVDLFTLQGKGRDFLLGLDTQAQETSDGVSEVIAESTKQAQ